VLNNIERLMSVHVGFRILCATVFLLVMAWSCWWLLIQPRQQQLLELERQNQQHWQEVLSLQQKIAAVPKVEQLPDVTPSTIFSAMAAVKLGGGRLVKWQPDPRRAVLEMLLPWPKVPLFFRQLADYSGLKIPTFVLSSAGEQVRVLLTLEFTDENR
jgi:pilus assembly protein HofO